MHTTHLYLCSLNASFGHETMYFHYTVIYLAIVCPGVCTFSTMLFLNVDNTCSELVCCVFFVGRQFGFKAVGVFSILAAAHETKVCYRQNTLYPFCVVYTRFQWKLRRQKAQLWRTQIPQPQHGTICRTCEVPSRIQSDLTELAALGTAGCEFAFEAAMYNF